MNLKSQKGATGADIIISITVIVMTVSIVSMIYVNTTLQGRNINRTAGATRIATNIIENINKMTYVDFVTEYNGANWSVVGESPNQDFYGYKTNVQDTVLNTKIPQGYTVYLIAENKYGSNLNSRPQKQRYDLIRDIKVIVFYDVGEKHEKVELSTVKKREIINEVNKPVLDVLKQQGFLGGNKKVYPIKYLESVGGYIKADENDADWYKYSARKWAMVVVSNKKEKDLFDINGKLLSNITGYEIYTWVPRFFYKEAVSEGEVDKFEEFQYLTESNTSIQEIQLTTTTPGLSDFLRIISFGPKKSVNTIATNYSGNRTGEWVKVKDSVNSNLLTPRNNETNEEKETYKYARILNNSDYGPCEVH